MKRHSTGRTLKQRRQETIPVINTCHPEKKRALKRRTPHTTNYTTGRRGGHKSEPEKTPNPRKQPENPSTPIRTSTKTCSLATNSHSTETQGGGGGHTSDCENQPIQQKEPENAPDHDRFIPKGAQMHAQKHPQTTRHRTVNPNPHRPPPSHRHTKSPKPL
jgi:hypothetical protein